MRGLKRSIAIWTTLGVTRLAADVWLPSVGLDSAAPQLTLTYNAGSAIQISLNSGGVSVGNVRWMHNDTTQVGDGSTLLVFPLEYADAGLYYAIYELEGREHRSQSFAAVVQPTAKMTNISARCFVSADQPAIVGFIVSGPRERKRFLVRAIGPSLAGFGIGNPLEHPTMDLFKGSRRDTNFLPQRNGNQNAFIVQATAATGAFELADGTDDLAAFHGLHKGEFTVVVGSGDGSAGEVLVEIYEYD